MCGALSDKAKHTRTQSLLSYPDLLPDSSTHCSLDALTKTRVGHRSLYYNIYVRRIEVNGQLPLSGGNAEQNWLEKFGLSFALAVCDANTRMSLKSKRAEIREPRYVESDSRDLCIVIEASRPARHQRMTRCPEVHLS